MAAKNLMNVESGRYCVLKSEDCFAIDQFNLSLGQMKPSNDSPKLKIIYDLGANNGDDIPYYLLKAELVIAVEANPLLANNIKERFKLEIVQGKLIVENCVVTIDDNSNSVSFYIHKNNHVLSQFPCPEDHQINSYEKVSLPSKNILQLIKTYGEPYYIKIDIEKYDHIILENLFINNIKPPYISAESHSIDVFALLVSMGKYEAFKLVDGNTVSSRYQNRKINTLHGHQLYSFPFHSAGPFGNDIDGSWINKNNFFRILGFAGLGWKDIHASAIDTADLNYNPQPHIQVSSISIPF